MSQISHFLTYVLGDMPDTQLSLYDVNLEVEEHKYYLGQRQIDRMLKVHGVSDARWLLPHMEEWTTKVAGYDQHGLYVVSDKNPWAKWDWFIMGGRWVGHLYLKEGRNGLIGKPGSFHDEPRWGMSGTDQCRVGDVDWDEMSRRLGIDAEDEWLEFQEDFNHYGEPARLIHSVGPNWDHDYFIARRSSPAPFAMVVDTDWISLDEIGWWGASLDSPDPELWEQKFDFIIQATPPETLITVADCHLGPSNEGDR